jgi:hypothetical protein
MRDCVEMGSWRIEASALMNFIPEHLTACRALPQVRQGDVLKEHKAGAFNDVTDAALYQTVYN